MVDEEKHAPGSEWRLGVEVGQRREAEAPALKPEIEHDPSSARLDRPVQVVTAEHVGWLLVTAWAVFSRLLFLGSRPLDISEARHALTELDLTKSGLGALGGNPAIHSAWAHLLEAGIFSVAGANDFSVRLGFALGGLVLVGVAFAMRAHVGRAGALGLATLLVISPTVTYFSRASAPVVLALAFTLVAVALFGSLQRHPGPGRAAAFGCAGGLALSADPTSLIVLPIFVAALALIGAWDLAAGPGNGYLRVRVWWHRRKFLVLLSLIVMAAVWLAFDSALGSRPVITAVGRSLNSNWRGAAPAGYDAGLAFYLPALAFYEFIVVILAAVGAAAFLALRMPSKFAAWAVIWSALALAFFLWTPSRSPGLLLQMLVPMALVAALGIDYLHHTLAWVVVRIPIALLLLFTIYLQVLANFVCYAPGSGQALGACALLYWTEPATTIQTVEQCALVESAVPAANDTVFFAQDGPVLRWYLRKLKRVANPRDAATIVGPIPAAAGWSMADEPRKYEFAFQERWQPRLGDLSPDATLRYLLGAHPWSALETRDIRIFVRKPAPPAPTVILAPVHSP
jgi:uncharacterized protein (TIGR03663 family)